MGNLQKMGLSDEFPIHTNWNVKRMTIDVSPASCPLCQCSCRKTFYHWLHHDICHVTLWCQAMMSHDIICHCNMGLLYLYMSHRQKVWNSHFFQYGDLELWPMTLIFKLIRDIIKVSPHQILGPYVRSWGHWITDRHTSLNTHTDETDFVPSTAEAGGMIIQMISAGRSRNFQRKKVGRK